MLDWVNERANELSSARDIAQTVVRGAGSALGLATSPPETSELDAGILTGRRALELVAASRALFPAYRRAVNALDPLAALELARNVLGTLNLAREGKEQILELLGDELPQHWMVSEPGKPELGELEVIQTWSTLGGLKLHLMGELTAWTIELSVQLGPQLLDGVPVMGSVTRPQLLANPVPYLVSEAGVVVELLGVVREAMRISNTEIGAPSHVTPDQAKQIVDLVTPWKSRPVNFKFLVAALTKLGLWDQITSVTGKSDSTLAETNTDVEGQVEDTGALADVGELDWKSLVDLIGYRSSSNGDTTYINRVTDEKAEFLVERLSGAAADARGPLIRQIQRMGRLGAVCDHLPYKTIEALHDAIQPFDREAAHLLEPYFEGKGGGRSMKQIYDDKFKENMDDHNYVRAYLWKYLAFQHNAVTFGFEEEYSQAYDLREAGLISSSAYRSAAGAAFAKAALVAIVSSATGGAAGEFFEGCAVGLGASESAASIIGSGLGGFVSGVTGHFVADGFDQATGRKQGFDSVGSYARAGAEGGLLGTVLGGISVGAGKYLGGGPQGGRPIDNLASRYPESAPVLERFRAAGQATGTRLEGVGTQIKVTGAELAEMIASGLAIPAPELAVDMARIPPAAEIEIAIAPMQMSEAKPGAPGASETPNLLIEDVAVVPGPPVAEAAAPRSTIKAPTGAEIEVATSGRALVPIGKVTLYPRGKVKPFTEEMTAELRELRRQKQETRKVYDKDPHNEERLKELIVFKHNHERSLEMSETLEKAGLPDTVEGNERIIKQLLELGQKVTEGNNENVKTLLVGTTGEVKAMTTWKILPDGRAYLVTIKMIPVSHEPTNTP